MGAIVNSQYVAVTIALILFALPFVLIFFVVKFAKERLVCSTHLLSLSVPVVLTRDVVLGLPPPLPLDRTLSKADIKLLHEQCLYFSGKFLEAIDRRFKL